MDKIKAVISCPIDVYSGYSSRSRDFVKALISSKPDWDIKILSQRWGTCRSGYLQDHGQEDLLSRIIPKLDYQPEYFFQITVPNEFQRLGKFNIGVTAGIETTLCHADWIDGCNRMDLVIVSSQHAKTVFENSMFDLTDTRTKQLVRKVALTAPIEVLFEGVDTDVYFPKNMPGKQFHTSDLTRKLDSIPEKYLFLNIGHWMQGDIGHDRKNIGYTVRTFLETFKNLSDTPALLLKTQQSTSSIIDRENLLDKIDHIRKSIKADTLPSIYLLHGDMLDQDINELYNHDKVKTLVSHTKGEGFGRPLLEFAAIGKPVIVSGWSGQVDFLDKDNVIFLGGTLEPVHPSASVDRMLLQEAKWFKPDDAQVFTTYRELYENYKNFLPGAKKQGQLARSIWSYKSMVAKLDSILAKFPEIPREVKLTLPKLKPLQLPQLKKI